MTRPAMEPLAEDIAELFAAERRAPRPSALREAGVLARLQPLVGVTAAVATGVGAGMAASAGAASAAATTSAAPTVAAGGEVVGATAPVTGAVAAAAKGAAVALPASKALIAGVALVVAGAGLGTSVYLSRRGDAGNGGAIGPAHESAVRAVAPRSEPVIERLEAAEPSPGAPTLPEAPSAAPAPIAVPAAAAPVTPPRAAPSRAPSGVASASSWAAASAALGGAGPSAAGARAGAPAPERRADMAAESALLEGARRALERGSVDAALVDLEKHARTYPAGYLTEEREVLWVRALALAGRREGAERRAAAFRRTFPRSIQLEALARALDAKP